ncbi:MAG: hypothetical protein H0W50_08100 [Parachlamydiaceae bacterium]|nr:hypothetical protein [Parachlamydiaceae bacterium]
MNIESWSRELLAGVCSSIVPNHPTKTQSLEAIQDYNTLRSVSKRLNDTMNSEYSIAMFTQAIWAKTFGSCNFPQDVLDWNTFLKHGFKVLRNWIDDTPQHHNGFITGSKFQSVKKNDRIELMNYDYRSEKLSRVQIESDFSTSKQELQLEGEVIAPGKMCYPFIAQTDDLMAINEGDRNVKIFIRHNGKILTLLENLGMVKQIEMFGEFIFILQQGDHGSCLLRFNTREIFISDRFAKNPDRLSLTSTDDLKNERVKNHVSRFFLSENRISLLSVIGMNLQLRTLCLSPTSKFPLENEELKWVSLITFPTSSYIGREGKNFIICKLKDFNLKRLRVLENSYEIEEIVENIPLSSPATEIVELYCNSGKVFIFYYSKKNSHHNVVTFDLETKKCSNSTDLPWISIIKPYSPSFAWHTTAERTNFMYFHLQPNEEAGDVEKLAITIIDYGDKI